MRSLSQRLVRVPEWRFDSNVQTSSYLSDLISSYKYLSLFLLCIFFVSFFVSSSYLSLLLLSFLLSFFLCIFLFFFLYLSSLLCFWSSLSLFLSRALLVLQYNTLEMDSVHREMGDALSRASSDHGSRIKQVTNLIRTIIKIKMKMTNNVNGSPCGIFRFFDLSQSSYTV